MSEAGVFGGVSLKAEDAGLEVLGWSCEASFLLAELGFFAQVGYNQDSLERKGR